MSVDVRMSGARCLQKGWLGTSPAGGGAGPRVWCWWSSSISQSNHHYCVDALGGILLVFIVNFSMIKIWSPFHRSSRMRTIVLKLLQYKEVNDSITVMWDILYFLLVNYLLSVVCRIVLSDSFKHVCVNWLYWILCVSKLFFYKMHVLRTLCREILT